ncbi:hypothetical protein GGI19_001210 [Coemansia pectinata]|uniref:Uncharacterized protein n=1 Tax=Coemansia pectinata TaxID=1052879 RepID=A0A9W8H3Y4_9FUNG|nr:hypothetical protein GGI19_001210 [Coemansia pectinata]
MSTTKTPEQRVATVFELLENSSQKGHIGGKMTRLDHALRAAQLANNDGADEETTLATLLVNIGHLIPAMEQPIISHFHYDTLDRLVDVAGNASVIDHGRVGGEYLRNLGFSDKTCELIESNVLAKRYLTTIDPDYLEPADIPAGTPGASPHYSSLLSSTDMSEFEKDSLFKQKVQLAKWDAAATKATDIKPPALNTYRDMAIRNLLLSMKMLY